MCNTLLYVSHALTFPREATCVFQFTPTVFINTVISAVLFDLYYELLLNIFAYDFIVRYFNI